MLLLPIALFGQGQYLAGIKELSVNVNIDEQLLNNGLSLYQIQNNVELALRLAKLRVLNEENADKPRFDIILLAYHSATRRDDITLDFYSYYLEVALMETAIISRNSLKSRAATFNQCYIGVIDHSQINSVYGKIDDLVKTFLNEYLDGNPL